MEGIAGPEHTVVVCEDARPRDTGAWRKKRPAVGLESENRNPRAAISSRSLSLRVGIPVF